MKHANDAPKSRITRSNSRPEHRCRIQIHHLGSFPNVGALTDFVTRESARPGTGRAVGSLHLPPGSPLFRDPVEERPITVVKLPNGTDARIQSDKIERYLLSSAHPFGRTKAHWFRAVEFDRVEQLRNALLDVARDGVVRSKAQSEYGRKYVVDGHLPTPRGTRMPIRTVWIIEHGDEYPRLVTAYPR